MKLTWFTLTLTLTLIPLACARPRPLVLWHGLGDSYASPGMLEFASMVKDVIPGIFIHSVYIDQDLDNDRRAGFYGNVDEQIDLVAGQLAGIDELQDGFDAIGFSQGGQFLRAYVERYNNPPIHNLLTFGSQHMGISDIPVCRPRDFLCQIARRATRGAVYGKWAQGNIVQAQYFRDPTNLPTYLKSNTFLTSINNEIPASRNTTYKRNLAALNKLVLIVFEKDVTVVPKESSWFGSEASMEEEVRGDDVQKPLRPSDSDNAQTPLPLPPPSKTPTTTTTTPKTTTPTIIPMHHQPLYTQDWIGLRALDERGGVVFESCPGEHMQLEGCWEGVVGRFVGGGEGGVMKNWDVRV